jgi:methylthioribose-1-phosphate isomerase
MGRKDKVYMGVLMDKSIIEINEMLPFVLRLENIGRYEVDSVVFCDRRKYPFEQEFMRCRDVESVATAIEQMVTQGGGPWVIAVYALALQAHRSAGKKREEVRSDLWNAADRLMRTRPTNTFLHRSLKKALQAAEDALRQGEDPEKAILAWMEPTRQELLQRSAKMGRFGADLIDDGDGILTMCFAETAFLLGLAFAKEDGKKIRVFVPETRPYLQGAKLTAPSVYELEIPVTLITDNMPTYIVSTGRVQKYFTAADLVTLDGHVVNKIGTFQNALACHYHRVPYFAYAWAPDPNKPNRESIEMEERNPVEIREAKGVPTTLSEIDAYYPAFDITPPHLVSGVITKFGILSAYDLARYFGNE